MQAMEFLEVIVDGVVDRRTRLVASPTPIFLLTPEMKAEASRLRYCCQSA
jgi:hypothetical protein